jgi:hypothetical protein
VADEKRCVLHSVNYVSLIRCVSHWVNYVSLIRCVSHWVNYVSLIRCVSHWVNYISYLEKFIILTLPLEAMPWLMWLISGISTQAGCYPTPVHVGFVVDKATLRNFCSEYVHFSLLISFYQCSIFIRLSLMLYNLCGWQHCYTAHLMQPPVRREAYPLNFQHITIPTVPYCWEQLWPWCYQ